MDPLTEPKAFNQGSSAATVTNQPMGNPPPYSGPAQAGFYPQPGFAAPVHTVRYGPTPYGPNTIHGQTATIHTVTPAAVIVTRSMGSKPARMTCNSCRAEIITRVEANPTTRTHLFALLLCLIGCWPCVCLPYCMDDCMSANHYCPNCNAYVGGYMN